MEIASLFGRSPQVCYGNAQGQRLFDESRIIHWAFGCRPDLSLACCFGAHEGNITMLVASSALFIEWEDSAAFFL